MNHVFVTVKKAEWGDYGGLATFEAVVGDDYVEDIDVTFLATPDLLASPPHEIVHLIADRDDGVADVIEAALQNGTDILVNDEPAVDHGAYRALAGAAPQP